MKLIEKLKLTKLFGNIEKSTQEMIKKKAILVIFDMKTKPD